MPEQGLSPTPTLATGSIADFEQFIHSSRGSLHDLFTPEEIEYCQELMGRYACRVAGKNTILQMLGGGAAWRDISIERVRGKRPQVRLTGAAAQQAHRSGIESFSISLAHDVGLSAACVAPIATGASSVKLGTDITSVARWARSLERREEVLFRRVFTPREDTQSGRDPERLAQMWAAKEAAVKALGTGFWREDVSWTEVEALLQPDDSYKVALSGDAAQQATEQGLTDWELYMIEHPQTPIAVASATMTP